MKNFIIAILTTVFLSIPLFANSDFYDWEDINKTMKGFEILFKNQKYTKLSLVSNDKFIKSDYFHILSLYIKEGYSVNLAYTREKCIKEFPVISGKYANKKLYICFVRKNDRKWYIDDAFLKPSQSYSSNLYFSQKGFKPLLFEFKFSDFHKALKNNKISDYLGLAPYGVLPTKFFNENIISKSGKTYFYILDIIIFKDNRIKALVYLKLTDVTQMTNNKRGWLIDESGTMIDYYEKYEEPNLLVDFLAGHDSIKNKKYDLNKKSSYFFAISSIDDAKKEGTLLTKIDISKIDNDKKTLQLVISLEKTSHIELKDIKCKLTSEKIYIDLSKKLSTAYTESTFLSARLNNGKLELTLLPEASFIFDSDSKLTDIRLNESEGRKVLSMLVRYKDVKPLKRKIKEK